MHKNFCARKSQTSQTNYMLLGAACLASCRIYVSTLVNAMVKRTAIHSGNVEYTHGTRNITIQHNLYTHTLLSQPTTSLTAGGYACRNCRWLMGYIVLLSLSPGVPGVMVADFDAGLVVCVVSPKSTEMGSVFHQTIACVNVFFISKSATLRSVA